MNVANKQYLFAENLKQINNTKNSQLKSNGYLTIEIRNQNIGRQLQKRYLQNIQ